jgi:hypothetical protein
MIITNSLLFCFTQHFAHTGGEGEGGGDSSNEVHTL